MDNKDKTSSNDIDSLEIPDTTPIDNGVVKAPESGNIVTSEALQQTKVPAVKSNRFHELLGKLNIYFILLVVLLMGLGVGAWLAIKHNAKTSKESNLKTQNLTQDALDSLTSTDSTVGDAKQTLTVESNAIFNGGMVVRGNLDVVGTLKSGSALSLPGLNVGGTTTLDQAALKSLTVTGESSLQGKLTLQNNLSVNGTAAFNGAISASQITVGTLILSKDLQLSHHIITSGSNPGRTQGSALGSGGTASVSGNDTSGAIVINTGGSAPAGCFVTISFSAAFSGTPRVIISPTSSSAATLDYYTTRSASSFSVCTASDPPDGLAGMTFDYFVVN